MCACLLLRLLRLDSDIRTSKILNYHIPVLPQKQTVMFSLSLSLSLFRGHCAIGDLFFSSSSNCYPVRNSFRRCPLSGRAAPAIPATCGQWRATRTSGGGTATSCSSMWTPAFISPPAGTPLADPSTDRLDRESNWKPGIHFILSWNSCEFSANF